jgi:hypothetical protein
MTDLEQLCLSPERAYEGRAALHRAQVTTRAMCEVGEITGAVVGHGMVLSLSGFLCDEA